VTGKTLAKDAAAVLNLLRRNLIPCDMDYCGKSLKAQLRYAEKTGAYFTIILGEEEQKEGAVIIKDMPQSTQEKIKINSLITILKSKLETRNIQ
jgi:histidyl-tRNA synthetase